MGMIDDIRAKVRTDAFEFSRHAVDQSIHRNISVLEIRYVIQSGEIIEDYPNDKYGPSCLIYGETIAGRALHIQCSYPSRPVLKIVILYEPDPEKWIDFRVRKP